MSDGGLGVLLIDDEAEFADSLALRLGRLGQGVSVKRAGSVADGLSLFRRERGSVDVIVTEVRFRREGDTAGLDVVRHASGADGVAPAVIVLTSVDERDVDVTALEAGASGVVRKWGAGSFDELARKIALSGTEGRRQRVAESMAVVVCKMVDLHEEYTGGHSERVGEYSGIIAAGSELGPLARDRARRAGLMHDLAKVGVPSEVIASPGDLTPEQWELIREHPVQGYAMLMSVGAEEEVARAVLGHHRRLNHEGYPSTHEALEGGCRPSRLAQVVGLGDSFDAMTSPRNYMEDGKGRFTFAKAVAELGHDARVKGAYDPALVAVLERELQKVWDVFVQHARKAGWPSAIIRRNLKDLPPVVAIREPAVAVLEELEKNESRGQPAP